MKLTRIKNLLPQGNPKKRGENSVSTDHSPSGGGGSSDNAPSTPTRRGKSSPRKSRKQREQGAPLPRHPDSSSPQQQTKQTVGSGIPTDALTAEEKRVMFTQKLRDLSQTLIGDAEAQSSSVRGSSSASGRTTRTGNMTAPGRSQGSTSYNSNGSSHDSRGSSSNSHKNRHNNTMMKNIMSSSVAGGGASTATTTKYGNNYKTSTATRLLDFKLNMRGGGDGEGSHNYNFYFNNNASVSKRSMSTKKRSLKTTTFAAVAEPTPPASPPRPQEPLKPIQPQGISIDGATTFLQEERIDEDRNGRQQLTHPEDEDDDDDDGETQEHTLAYTLHTADDAFTTLKMPSSLTNSKSSPTATTTRGPAKKMTAARAQVPTTATTLADAVLALLPTASTKSYSTMMSSVDATSAATGYDASTADVDTTMESRWTTDQTAATHSQATTLDETTSMDNGTMMDQTIQSMEDSRWCDAKTFYTYDQTTVDDNETMDGDSKWCAETQLTTGFSTIDGNRDSRWCGGGGNDTVTAVDTEYTYGDAAHSICTWGDQQTIGDTATLASKYTEFGNATQVTETSQYTTRLWYKFLFSCSPAVGGPNTDHKLHVDEADHIRQVLDDEEEDKYNPPMNPCMAPAGAARTAACVVPSDSRLASFLSMSEDTEDQEDRRSGRSPRVSNTRFAGQDVRQTSFPSSSSASSSSSESDASSSLPSLPPPLKRNRTPKKSNHKKDVIKAKHRHDDLKPRRAKSTPAHVSAPSPPRKSKNSTSYYREAPRSPSPPRPVFTPTMNVPGRTLSAPHHSYHGGPGGRRGRSGGVHEIAFVNEDYVNVTRHNFGNAKTGAPPPPTGRSKPNWMFNSLKKAANGFRGKPTAAVVVPNRTPYFDDSYYDDDEDNSTLSTNFSLMALQRQQQLHQHPF